MTDLIDRLTFRPASESDWGGVWRVVREVIGRGDTYMFAPDMPEDEARLSWWFVDRGDRRTTYVALDDDVVIATAILKPNHPGLGDHVANAAWMVHPSAAGQGIGRAFATYVIDEARRQGFRGMQFNAVVSTNERALRLWESLGFAIVGTIPAAFRHAARGETSIHIMHRAL